MPRLSVDIDLTYIPLEDRNTSINKINQALERIKRNIKREYPYVQISHDTTNCNLKLTSRQSNIKIEVNTINRGLISNPLVLPLTNKIQSLFGKLYSVLIAPKNQI